MNRILKIFIGTGILIIGLTIFSKIIFKSFVNSDTLINKIGCRLFEFNTINVKSTFNLDLKKIQIKIGERIVFKNSQQQNRIGQEYGHTILDIYYDDLIIAEVGHFKTNNWYTNEYEIEISKNENHLVVNHKIRGPSAGNDNFQKRYVYDNLKTLYLIIFFCSCNLEQKKIEQELSKYILNFNSKKDSFSRITDEMKKENLLLGPETLAIINNKQFSKDLNSKISALGIKTIKYGRYMPCDAMTEDLREIFFHINDTIAYWYCPCMNLSKKNHYHKNTEIRGYKDLIDFNSIGLGGSWAMIKIKSE